MIGTSKIVRALCLLSVATGNGTALANRPVAPGPDASRAVDNRVDMPLEKTALAKLGVTMVHAMQDAKRGDLLPAIIVMRAQVPRDEMDRARAISNKAARRRAVVDLLKSLAGRTQEPVLVALRRGQTAGTVGSRIEPLWLSNVIGADVTSAQVAALAGRDDVARVHLDALIKREDVPVEPLEQEVAPRFVAGPLNSSSVVCGVELTRAPRVWEELDITGRGVVVCMIDSGTCVTHPDLKGQTWINEDEIPNNGIDDDQNGFIDDVYGWNFSDGGNNNVFDPDGHGTHVAGIVGGDGSNGLQTGMAPDVSLMTCKYEAGDAFETTVWQAMEYAVDNGADVISGSIGLLHRRDPDRSSWRRTCENVMATGVAVIFAAGNAGNYFPPVDNIATPADVPDVIAVGATDCTGHYVEYTSMGPTTWQNVQPYNDWPYPPGKIKPSLSASGNEIRSTWNDCAGYMDMSGTSMATPHVAGAAALMLEANPNLDHAEIKEILEDTAVDRGAPGKDNIYGAGVIDAYEAVLAARGRGITCDDIASLTGKCKMGDARGKILWKLKTKKRLPHRGDILTLRVTPPGGQSVDLETRFKGRKAKWKLKRPVPGRYDFRLESPKCPSFDGSVDCP